MYAIVEDDITLQVALSMSNVATFNISAQINSIDNNTIGM